MKSNRSRHLQNARAEEQLERQESLGGGKATASLFLGVLGATIGVLSIHLPWIAFPTINETQTGAQLDTFFVKSIGYSLWTNIVYVSLVFVALSVGATVFDTYSLGQVKVRTVNSLLLLASSVCVFIPLVRLFVAIGFSPELTRLLAHGFWLSSISFGLLLITWGASIWRIKETPSGNDVICSDINKLMAGGKDAISLAELARKYRIEVGLLRTKCRNLSSKNRLPNAYVTEDEIVSKACLRKRLEEALR